MSFYKNLFLNSKQMILVCGLSLVFSGCSGCGYFYLNLEDLNKTEKSSELPTSNTPPNEIIKESPIISIEDYSTKETDISFLTETGFKVSLNKISDKPVSVQFQSHSIYAIKDIDFILSDGILMFEPGEISKVISFNVIGDLEGEGLETFSLSLSNPQNAQVGRDIAFAYIEDNDPIILKVNPRYPNFGSNWNDYIQLDFTSKSMEDSSCLGTLNFCKNGGELKKVIIPGEYSCVGLSLTDNLDAFDWKCSETELPVFFYSQGLKINKNLSDLITPNNFHSNFVQLNKNLIPTYTSLSQIWWNNSFIDLNLSLNSGNSDPVLTLNNSGTIYTISGGGEKLSRGILINVPKTSLVIMPGTILAPNTSSALPLDCDLTVGIQSCLIHFIATSFNWLEGSFKGYPGISTSFTGVITTDYYTSNHHINMQNINIDSNGAENGLFIGRSTQIKISNGIIKNAQINGVTNQYCVFCNFHHLKIHNNTTGLFTNGIAMMNTYFDIITFLNSNYGIYDSEMTSNFIQIKSFNNNIGYRKATLYTNFLNKFLLVNNTSDGLNINFSNASTLVFNSTIISNGSNGINLYLNPGNPDHINLISNSIIQNNTIGLELDGEGLQDLTTFKDLYIAQNDIGIKLNTNLNNDKWENKIFLNNTTNCNVLNSAKSNPGLSNTCQPIGNSSAIILSGVNYSQNFIGESTDSVNLHNSGSALFETISDWFNFENVNRVWGFLNSRMACNSTGQTCKIVDLSINTLSNEIQNYHGTITEDTPCPPSVNGNKTITSLFILEIIFLEHAIEIMDDHIGNENGFCESFESCYFTPNIGFDQNENGAKHSCIFTDGTGSNGVTNVKMYGFTN